MGPGSPFPPLFPSSPLPCVTNPNPYLSPFPFHESHFSGGKRESNPLELIICHIQKTKNIRGSSTPPSEKEKTHPRRPPSHEINKYKRVKIDKRADGPPPAAAAALHPFAAALCQIWPSAPRPPWRTGAEDGTVQCRCVARRRDGSSFPSSSPSSSSPSSSLRRWRRDSPPPAGGSRG